MTELDEKIAQAIASDGEQDKANQFYLTLIRTEFLIPTHKESLDNDEFTPLSMQHDGKYFMLAFDTEQKLHLWAKDHIENINYVKLSGKELLAGISDGVCLCINLGTAFYKELAIDEIKYLQKFVAKIEELHAGQAK